MKRLFLLWILVSVGVGMAQDLPRYTVNVGRVEPDTFGVAIPDEDGPYVMFENVEAAIDAAVAEALAGCQGAGGAAGLWMPLPLLPAQDERGLLCEVKAATGTAPAQYAFRDFVGGQWRVGTTVGPAPLAWAKINPRIVP